MYKVIKLFTDLQDGRHLYNVGDTFPRDGVEVSEDRINELAGSDNKQGTPLIEEIPTGASPLAEETLEDVETDVNPPKKTKGKKSTKKAQE